MSELADFQRRQFELTAHIRDPARHPAPADVEDRRLAIYRDLLFNNVEGLLAKSFPVLRRIHDDARWQRLVRDYFRDHRAQSPYFMEVPQEFLAYLQHERTPGDDDFPFLLELAHYEWAELAISIMDTAGDERADVDPDGDLLAGVPVLQPAAWSLGYTFPVHRIGPDFLPREPGEQPTWLVVYRDADDAVRFLDINAVTARLIELIRSGERLTGRAILERIAGEMQHPRPEVVVDGGAHTLQTLRERGIVRGTLGRCG